MDLGVREICKQVDIDVHTYYNWLAKPEFQEMLQKYRNNQSISDATETDKALKKEILKGNVAAIRTFYERRKEIGRENPGEGNTININIITTGKPTVEKTETN